MDDYRIYPKQFRSARIPIEKNRCFVLMPFDKGFDAIYGEIKNDLNDNGYVCNRADEISGAKPIINKILTEILKSQYVIADLTNYNPNVFYELGIAHTFKDAANILLIKQKGSKAPFDITHLTYIEYEPNNLKRLTSMIKQFIEQNTHIVEFYEILHLRGVLDIIHDNKDEFVDYVRTLLGDTIHLITALLNHNYREFSETEIDKILYDYNLIIKKVIEGKDYTILDGVLKIYYELIISCSTFSITDVYINKFLTEYFLQFSINESDILSWQTDMSLSLANTKTKLNIVMPWIINYFSRSKSATIDLNRYKIERFLMTSQYLEINQIIINAIFDKNCYIREHLADIIGEKRLIEAKLCLFKQLASETNVFTATSIIAAIGKLDNPEGIFHIEEWIKSHKDELIETRQFFVMKHARNAIKLLDKSNDLFSVNNFDKNYDVYLKDYFIL
jgi:hypothetical protein